MLRRLQLGGRVLTRHSASQSSRSGTASMDPHAVLGVPKGASAEEVRESYLRLSKLYHPDRNASQQARASFQQVLQAYDELTQQNRTGLDGPTWQLLGSYREHLVTRAFNRSFFSLSVLVGLIVLATAFLAKPLLTHVFHEFVQRSAFKKQLAEKQK